VRTNTLTNKQTPVKTSTSLCYTTPVGNKLIMLMHTQTRNVGQCPTWWSPCRI